MVSEEHAERNTWSQMIRPELSIIIPIYNVESYLEQCLESIVCQIRPGGESAAEVILVDDGSTDGSGRVADRFAGGYSYIQVIHQKNSGVAAARNRGTDRAQGEWLYFMDADDWLAEEGISLLYRAIRKHREADLILLDAYQDAGTRCMPWEHFGTDQVWTGQPEIDRLQRAVLYYHMDYPHMKTPLAAPWDKVYRRAFLKKQGIVFCEELAVLDDMIFNMEVFGRAKRVSYEKSKIYHYRRVATSITNAYKANRVDQDRKVWRYIVNYREGQVRGGFWNQEEEKAFTQAYYCRIIRSFAICCSRNFYHRANGKSHRRKQAYVREVLHSSPYEEAFEKVRMCHLEWRLRIVVWLVRKRMHRGLYLLFLLQKLLSER